MRPKSHMDRTLMGAIRLCWPGVSVTTGTENDLRSGANEPFVSRVGSHKLFEFPRFALAALRLAQLLSRRVSGGSGACVHERTASSRARDRESAQHFRSSGDNRRADVSGAGSSVGVRS